MPIPTEPQAQTPTPSKRTPSDHHELHRGSEARDPIVADAEADEVHARWEIFSSDGSDDDDDDDDDNFDYDADDERERLGTATQSRRLLPATPGLSSSSSSDLSTSSYTPPARAPIRGSEMYDYGSLRFGGLRRGVSRVDWEMARGSGGGRGEAFIFEGAEEAVGEGGLEVEGNAARVRDVSGGEGEGRVVVRDFAVGDGGGGNGGDGGEVAEIEGDEDEREGRHNSRPHLRGGMDDDMDPDREARLRHGTGTEEEDYARPRERETYMYLRPAALRIREEMLFDMIQQYKQQGIGNGDQFTFDDLSPGDEREMARHFARSLDLFSFAPLGSRAVPMGYERPGKPNTEAREEGVGEGVATPPLVGPAARPPNHGSGLSDPGEELVTRSATISVEVVRDCDLPNARTVIPRRCLCRGAECEECQEWGVVVA